MPLLSDATTLLRAADWAGGITATLILGMLVWLFFTGKLPTPRERTDLERDVQFWQEKAEKYEANLDASSDRLYRASDALPDIARELRAIHERLDHLNVPEEKDRRTRARIGRWWR